MIRRTRRTARGNPRHECRLTERDLWLLEGLAKMRFLTTSQLAKLYFADSRWSANKRLRNLLDADLLRVWVRSLSQDNVYSISREGLETLFEKVLIENSLIKIPREPDGNLDHLLAINEVRIAFAIGLGVGTEILWWKSDWELRRSRREKIIPDAIFMIRWENSVEQTYALELDNLTKSIRSFLKKLVGYVSQNYGGGTVHGITAPILLVVVKDPKWLERYRTAAANISQEIRMWFINLSDLAGGCAKDRIWTDGKGQMYSLRDLSFYPYSKDRFLRKL